MENSSSDWPKRPGARHGADSGRRGLPLQMALRPCHFRLPSSSEGGADIPPKKIQPMPAFVSHGSYHAQQRELSIRLGVDNPARVTHKVTHIRYARRRALSKPPRGNARGFFTESRSACRRRAPPRAGAQGRSYLRSGLYREGRPRLRRRELDPSSHPILRLRALLGDGNTPHFRTHPRI